MQSVKDTIVVKDKWHSLDGEEHERNEPLFGSREIERAETIVEALEGLTIESAQMLLAKVNKYLLQSVV